jgi:hypothetical protein
MAGESARDRVKEEANKATEVMKGVMRLHQNFQQSH